MVLLAVCLGLAGRKVTVPAVPRGWRAVVTNEWCIRMRITTVKGSFGEVYHSTLYNIIYSSANKHIAVKLNFDYIFDDLPTPKKTLKTDISLTLFPLVVTFVVC